jgi:hypothetical protein
MSVATLSETRVWDRRLEYARENVMDGIVNNALDASAGCSAFMGRMSVAMFGQADTTNRGKRTGTGESTVTKPRLGANTTFQSVAGPYGTFDTTPSDTVRHARWNWGYYGGTVNISYNEIRQAGGDNAFADIVQEEMSDGVASCVDAVEGDLYTGTGANAIVGLNSIISAATATETATVGGLSGTTYGNWNSRGVTARGTAVASISFTGGSFATTGLQNWRLAWENASEGNMTPHALLTTHDIKTFYEASLQPQERFNSPKLADGGFQMLQFKTAPVIPAPRCISGSTFFLNFDTLYFSVLDGADFESNPFIEPETQNVRVSKVFSTLQLCCSGRKFNNKVISITA